MRRYRIFSLALVLWASLAGAQQPAPLQVVVSFSILADWVQQIGGDQVRVTSLVGPDQDAHTYQPRPADAKHLAEADLVISNGLGFEPWLQASVRASGSRAHLCVASQGITPRFWHATDGAAQPDPHAWQSLRHARHYLHTIALALGQARPSSTAYFQNRLHQYDQHLQVLEQQYHSLTQWPAQRRRFLTSHDAFGYWEDEYGLVFLAPQGVSTEQEARPRDLVRLIQQIRREGVTAVFLENMVNPRQLAQLAKDAQVAPGGVLYADALSGPDGPAATYLAMMQHNLAQLRAALGPLPTAATH
jgi:zinc/manganese transport system substrate-binding protein